MINTQLIHKKISIIIPVYDAEKYLNKCLDSLLAQTFKNIEVLCINDGSKDSSLDILHQYTNEDTRIRIFTQENAGVGTARNVGLQNATGQYVMFCDADDWYEPTMCEAMFNAIEQNQVDFVMCDTNVITENGNIYNRGWESLKYYYLKYPGIYLLTQPLKAEINVLLWNKIFKMELIQQYQIKFPNTDMAEDDAFLYQYLAISSLYFGLPQKLYNYRLSENSITSDIFSHNRYFKLFSYISVHSCTLNFLKKYDLFGNNKWVVKCFNNNLMYVSRFFSKNELKIYINRLREEVLLQLNPEDIIDYKLLDSCLKNNLGKIFRYTSHKKVHTYLGGIFKKVKNSNKKEYYFCGIKLFQKNLIKDERQDLKLIHKFESFAKNYKNIPFKDKYIICFDCLYDINAEAIDAYTFFQFLQQHNIKSKYFILKNNKLAKSLASNKDVILIKRQNDFFKYFEIIAQSSYILTSFGLNRRFNTVIKNFSFLKYVFIEHGVFWFKRWVSDIYSESYFDYVLVPSKKTFNIYNQQKLWPKSKMFCNGLPRWDKLTKETNQTKNIFIFFTWRKSFEQRPELSIKYFNISITYYLIKHYMKLFKIITFLLIFLSIIQY